MSTVDEPLRLGLHSGMCLNHTSGGDEHLHATFGWTIVYAWCYDMHGVSVLERETETCLSAMWPSTMCPYPHTLCSGYRTGCTTEVESRICGTWCMNGSKAALVVSDVSFVSKYKQWTV